MKLLAQVRLFLIVGATLGLLMPPTAFAGTQHRASPIRDVALRHAGALHGAIVSAQGQGAAGQTVTLSVDGEIVARGVAAVDGKFVIAGIRPGIYLATIGESQTVLRLWSEAAAPPVATQELLLVDQQSQIVRGAHGGHLPQWDHPFLVGGLLVTAGVIGGVIGYNIKDDAS